MKKELFIVGAGSVGGHVALNIEEYSEEYTILGFFDDDPAKVRTRQFGFDVIGPVETLLHVKNAEVVIGIAFPGVKQTIIERLSVNSTIKFPSLIHKNAWISRDVSIGQGCIIYPGTTINFGSKIDDFVVLNANCALGHHTHIGAYSSLAPGVNTGGHTTFEEGVDVGIGVSTLQDMVIGAGSIIGGQSVITRHVESGSTVVGVPARALHKKVKLREVDVNL